MKTLTRNFIYTCLIGLMMMTASACGGASSATNPVPIPAAAPLPPEAESSEVAIRYLEDKVKGSPDDFIAYNKLAGYYLQLLRETGSTDYLNLAERAARLSLSIIPAEMNSGGLYALAQVEFASHNFQAARDHARQLIERDPSKSYPYLMLGDALIEMGQYDDAIIAFNKSDRLTENKAVITARFARLAFLEGKVDASAEKLARALSLALEESVPQRETVAWMRWQLGETAFLAGDYQSAEQHYRDALTTFPDYYRALGSLGRVMAARGDLAGAIESYERAIAKVPDPVFVAALGDLYKLAGREKDAASQYALVEQIARLGKSGGAIYNRHLALFYADHDLKAEEAYTLAKKEYETRSDIYGADALAWTALKAGKTGEAQSAIKEALRRGTRDAKLFYHAAMIYRAAGDKATAKDYLERALKLSPGFDPLQAAIARRALEEL